MQSAFVAALARPGWWAMALAAFLVRGGIVVALLPILSLPSAAGMTTTLAPSLEALVLGRGSLEGVIVGTLFVAVVLAALLAAALAGSWLDLALVREAADDDDLDLGWSPASLETRGRAVQGLAIRLAAHLPTMVATGYAAIRLVGATYAELLDPGDTAVPFVARVLLRAPDAVVPVVLAWLLGEAIGALAARRAAAGEPTTLAVRRAVRQVLGPAGLATLALTTLVLIAVAGAFVLTAGRAWEHLGTVLVGGAGSLQLAAALVLFVSTWMLGLALLGAALAWRGSAWTILLSPAGVGSPEVVPAAAREAAGG
jgi:hypothetical protein